MFKCLKCDNIANGTLKQWHLEDVSKLPRDESVTLPDTRTDVEYCYGHNATVMNDRALVESSYACGIDK